MNEDAPRELTPEEQASLLGASLWRLVHLDALRAATGAQWAYAWQEARKALLACGYLLEAVVPEEE